MGEPYEIVAYADYDVKLQNTTLLGKPVIQPSDIASYDYEQIIIAARDADGILKQLVETYNIPMGIINSIRFTVTRSKLGSRCRSGKCGDIALPEAYTRGGCGIERFPR